MLNLHTFYYKLPKIFTWSSYNTSQNYTFQNYYSYNTSQTTRDIHLTYSSITSQNFWEAYLLNDLKLSVKFPSPYFQHLKTFIKYSEKSFYLNTLCIVPRHNITFATIIVSFFPRTGTFVIRVPTFFCLLKAISNAVAKLILIFCRNQLLLFSPS